MSEIPCKQSTIEMTGWFKHYFPGNLRRNIGLADHSFTDKNCWAIASEIIFFFL